MEKADLIFRISNDKVVIWDEKDPIYQDFINQKIEVQPHTGIEPIITIKILLYADYKL
jgi:hypothetical protein